MEGWQWLTNQPGAAEKLLTELCTAALVGLVASLAAWMAARRLISQRCPVWVAAACLCPGLCGGLTVGLAMLWLSSQPLFAALPPTPIWWVMALVLWLLPRALLLQLWLHRQTEPAALHLVRMLWRSPVVQHRAVGQQWWWRGQIEPQLAASGLLWYWAYLDLTQAVLLAPPGMASIMVRLYNFMHFGHSAAMSMEATLAMLVPLLTGGLMVTAVRFALRNRQA